jgi:hypothetical protein
MVAEGEQWSEWARVLELDLVLRLPDESRGEERRRKGIKGSA